MGVTTCLHLATKPGLQLQFDRERLARLIDVFGGDHQLVQQFVEERWIPEVVQALRAVIQESHNPGRLRLRVMCDQLRDVALAAGAQAVVDAAELIDCVIDDGSRELVRMIARNALEAVKAYSAVLLPPERAAYAETA